MDLFGIFRRRTSNTPPTAAADGPDRRAARQTAAAVKRQGRQERRARAAAQAEVEAFVRYLDHESTLSYGGDSWSVAQREDHQEDARYIASLYREHLAKHGPSARAASLDELLVLVSPDHEGWGLDRSRVQYWISEYRHTHRPAGQSGNQR